MKHQLRRAVMTLLVVFLAWPTLAQGSEVLNLAPYVQVTGARITLLDLAAPDQGLSTAMSERLRQMTLGASPALGRQSVISGVRLRALLHQANLGPAVSVNIPEQVTVERASQRLTSQDLEKMYVQAVGERLGERARQADIHDVATINRDLVLPAGALTTQARILGGSWARSAAACR